MSYALPGFYVLFCLFFLLGLSLSPSGLIDTLSGGGEMRSLSVV